VFAAFGEADHIISIKDVQRLRNCLTVAATRSTSARARRTAGLTTPCQGVIAGHRPRLPGGATAIPVRVFAGGYDPKRAEWRFDSESSLHDDFTKNVRME
jgi:hypothetical protein